jgi:hypothetical protein
MDLRTFCTDMRDEMNAWKAKTYDLIRKAEEMSPSPDQKVRASIDDMKAMIDRIEQTLGRLEKECPVNWDSEKNEIDQVVCDMKERWIVVEDLSPDDLE